MGQLSFKRNRFLPDIKSFGTDRPCRNGGRHKRHRAAHRLGPHCSVCNAHDDQSHGRSGVGPCRAPSVRRQAVAWHAYPCQESRGFPGLCGDRLLDSWSGDWAYRRFPVVSGHASQFADLAARRFPSWIFGAKKASGRVRLISDAGRPAFAAISSTLAASPLAS